jgi:hypothetical protein
LPFSQHLHSEKKLTENVKPSKTITVADDRQYPDSTGGVDRFELITPIPQQLN